MGTTVEKLNKILQSKEAIKAAIESKGVAAGNVLAEYAEMIKTFPGEVNNQHKTVEITENGESSVTFDSGYTGLATVTINTQVSGGKSKWTGHADVEGLKAIGWTDEDIQYYQENGVNWNEEDDELHKVPQDNIELYGVLTADNIQEYAHRIKYLPKIDTSHVTSMYQMFYKCYSLVSIPLLDTSQVTNMGYMFSNCYSLVSIPLLDTSQVTNMGYMFSNCYSLVSIPLLDTSQVTNMEYMFTSCYSLVSIPLLDTSQVTNMKYMFSGCYSLVSIPLLDTSQVTNMEYMFTSCYSLATSLIKNLKTSLEIKRSSFLSKESLLYIIQNASPTSSITITLHPYVYDKYAEDAEIKAAIAAQPLVSLAK